MFFLFMAALKEMVLKPVGQALEQREQRIKGNIEAGAVARNTAVEIVADYDRRMHEARQKAQGIVSDVLLAAQRDRQAEVKTFHESGVNKAAKAAKKAIAAERANLVGNLAEVRRDLVGTIIKKLLGESTSVVVDADKARQVLVEEAS